MQIEERSAIYKYINSDNQVAVQIEERSTIYKYINSNNPLQCKLKKEVLFINT